VHIVVYSKDPDADRAFFKDTLGFRSVDAGQGWLIFAVPAAEVAFHPDNENNKHEMFFTCDDIEVQMADLRKYNLASGWRHNRAISAETSCHLLEALPSERENKENS
jgi:hypothetical protein